jgi:hypothetical protein
VSFVHLEESPFGIDGWKTFVVKDVFGFADLQTEKQITEIKHLASNGECRGFVFEEECSSSILETRAKVCHPKLLLINIQYKTKYTPLE